jgi:transposase
MGKPRSPRKPSRYIGLDIHKKYMVAAGVDRKKEQVMPFQRVEWADFDAWIKKNLTRRDAVVIEMTTNTWEVYDQLVGKVHSVTVVHPPHVKLIVGAQVMNDKKAALILAKELADNRLPGVWVPPKEVRELRTLIAQRWKMVRLGTLAKNRLHSALHRHHLARPEGSEPFHPKHQEFWMNLDLPPMEKVAVQIDWATVYFAQQQKDLLDDIITEQAAKDDRVLLLVQMPGMGLIVAMTILAAVGDITRFPSAKHLVGYAGLGAKVHDSGETKKTGRITKRGRKDLRAAMATAAQAAVRCSPHWKAIYERLEARIGKPKAIVAIARKLLVAVWHILTAGCADRFADPVKVARAFFGYAFDIQAHLRQDQRKLVWVRHHLDRLKLGQELERLKWSRKRYKLPPSGLAG